MLREKHTLKVCVVKTILFSFDLFIPYILYTTSILYFYTQICNGKRKLWNINLMLFKIDNKEGYFIDTQINAFTRVKFSILILFKSYLLGCLRISAPFHPYNYCLGYLVITWSPYLLHSPFCRSFLY